MRTIERNKLSGDKSDGERRLSYSRIAHHKQTVVIDRIGGTYGSRRGSLQPICSRIGVREEGVEAHSEAE